MSLVKLVTLCFLLCGPFALSWGGSLGRFTGVFQHEKIKREQLAKLDFILSREEENKLLLKAVLSLHFGGFENSEYVAYHFNKVEYNVKTGEFIFDQADQPVTLLGTLSKEGEFIGEFRSTFSGQVGSLKMKSSGPVKPILPLLEPVRGEFKGKCKNKSTGEMVETVLQLHTYKSPFGPNNVGNPFGAYSVKGFIGEKFKKPCFGAAGEYCVWGNVRGASYNFFENRLFVYNDYRNLSCVPQGNGLNCTDCEFLKRVSLETKEPRTLSPIAYPSSFEVAKVEGEAALLEDINAIQGSYRGYIHNEFLDIYQQGQLNILTYQEPNGFRMSAVGTIYFGSFESSEFISYHFTERSYPVFNPQFVFDNTEVGTVTDAIVQVQEIGKGIVKGIWFSRGFGRLGRFEFRKDGLPSLPANAKVAEMISGRYQGPEWELDISAGLGSSAGNATNPFAPMTFDGWTSIPNVTGRTPITGGSYDFYTGRIGIEVGEKVVHLGQRISRSKLMLKKMSAGIQARVPEFTPDTYTFMGEATKRDHFNLASIANLKGLFMSSP